MITAGRLGVVIVAYRHPDSTERCLRSISEDPSATARDVVVVDNSPASHRGAPDASLASATLLRRPDNPGYGAAANYGVEHLRFLRGDHDGFVVLNHDVEIRPGFLDATADALLHPEVGAASGPIYLDRADGPLWYAGGEIRWLTGTVHQSCDPDDARSEHEVEFIPGTALALRREAWTEVGGFDESIFLYHEDLEICRRLHELGWKLLFHPSMVAVHRMGVSTGSRRYSAFYLEHLTRTRFSAWRSLPYRLYLAALHTPYVALRCLRILSNEGMRAGWPKVRALLRGHRGALLGLFSGTSSGIPRQS